MFSVEPLATHTGSAISGVDLSRPLDHAIAAGLLRELDARGVLLIRDQQLAPQQLIAFCRALGELAVHPMHKFSHAEFPELMLHSNIADNGVPIGYTDTGQRWRMDGAHLKTPHRATVQYAVEIPVQSSTPLGATCFANTAAAFEALAPGLQTQLRGMHAAHPYRPGQKRRTIPFYMDAGLSQTFRRGVEHPVVRMHPVTGRLCLYVSQGSTSFIRGMHDHDSDALLAQIYQHLSSDPFVYRHAWQPGDVLIWDNNFIQHRTDCDYALPLRRLLYQVQIKGVAHAPARLPMRNLHHART